MSKEKNANLKKDDRVKRVNSPGCQGTVLSVRKESVGSSGSTDEKGLLIQVKWDNGTVSYFAPEGVELA